MEFKYPTDDVINLLQEKGYIRGPFGSALKRADMIESGIPVYEQSNVIYNNRTFRYFISDEKAKKLKRFFVEENDLLISCSGTVGKVSIVNKDDETLAAQITTGLNMALKDGSYKHLFLKLTSIVTPIYPEKVEQQLYASCEHNFHPLQKDSIAVLEYTFQLLYQDFLRV